MSNIAIQGAATGTGVFTLASPATNTDRTLVLPDEAGTVLTDRVVAVDASAPDNSVVVDASGNVGIDTTSPGSKLEVAAPSSGGAVTNGIAITNAGGGVGTGSSLFLGYGTTVGKYGSVSGFYDGTGTALTFGTTPSASSAAVVERARIDSSGNLLVGTTSSSQHSLVKDRAAGYATSIINSSASAPYGLQLALTGVSGGGGAAFLVCQDNANRLIIAGSGNVTNANNSYGALSDIKLKENIVDATPKLEKLKQVRIVNYNLIGEEQKQLGVIAQELEQIFPSMIDESPDRDAKGNLLETTTKGVKYSVFVPMLIKAIQEQQEIIESLTARVVALEGQP